MSNSVVLRGATCVERPSNAIQHKHKLALSEELSTKQKLAKKIKIGQRIALPPAYGIVKYLAMFASSHYHLSSARATIACSVEKGKAAFPL